VWDTDDAVWSSRYTSIWGVKAEQFPAIPRALEIFRYFTDESRAKKFIFRMDELTWPILAYLVDLDLREEHRAWAWEKYGAKTKAIGAAYNDVPYDYGKKDRRVTKLGERPYTLPNLLKYGGVCGDRAYYLSRVAKSLGIPAFKSSGLAVHGGMGHVFTWHFLRKKGRLRLEATGRYFHDHYYKGTVFDPQTRTLILDRTVAMMLDGASLSYEKYILSRTLVRMARKLYDEDPEASLALVKKSLTVNWFCAPGWKLLMEHCRDGRLPQAEGIQWANKMMRYVADHPDLTLEAFSSFLDCIPPEAGRKRQSFYNRAAKMYEDRPDLEIELRTVQGGELLEAGQERKAMVIFLDTASRHGKQGRHVLALLTKGLDLASKLGCEKKIVPYLDRLLDDFPKKRGRTTSSAFRKLVEILAPAYERAGKKREADKLRKAAQS
jgi:hypothetical protein